MDDSTMAAAALVFTSVWLIFQSWQDKSEWATHFRVWISYPCVAATAFIALKFINP